MEKNNYFWLHGTGPDEDGGAVAYAPKNYDSFDERAVSGNKRVISTFKKLEEVSGTFEVREGMLQDYLSNNMDYPLMSVKLQELIDNNTRIKLYRWLKVKIKNVRTNEIIVYYMPLFENKVDTIDYKNCKYEKDGKTVLVACYSLQKIKDLDFFPKHDETSDQEIGKPTPYFVDSYLVVSKKIKEAIIENNLTGIKFSEVRLAS